MAQTQSPTETARQHQAHRDEEQTRDAAEAKTADLPLPGSPDGGRATGASWAKAHGEGTVKMMIPNGFTLTTDDYQGVDFKAGIDEVPASMVDHPYLKAQGATKV
jgi:hypothetical protein